MKTGMVFEGGAFRTVFSCGVMDAFLDLDIMPNYIIGVSAGAAYGTSYVSKQKGRNLTLIKEYCNDKRYMGIGNLLNPKNKCYYGLKFAYETIPTEILPFDYDTYRANPVDFYATVTNVETGEAEYLLYDVNQVPSKTLIATCALPMLFPIVKIKGKQYLDGGISDSIPFKKALEDGCDRVVVVLTRQPDYRKTTSGSTKLAAKMYSKYPALAKALLNRADNYNRCLDELAEYEKEGKVIVIRPDSTDGFSRMEKDKAKIQALYDDGFKKGMDYGDRIKEFFNV
ncbi:MAG: patatin family protein [Lachnospira sp.]|nr:patatin family protein [Lachnospira sp.]